jgi:hypothetical protein
MSPQLRLSPSDYRKLRRPRADVKVRRKIREAVNAQLWAEVHHLQTFELSLCPSVNALYTNVRGVGRVKTKAYRSWIKCALGELMCQRAKPCATPAKIAIMLPDGLKSDPDGRAKASIDLLIRAGVLPDDNSEFVRSITIDFSPITGMRVSVVPMEDGA